MTGLEKQRLDKWLWHVRLAPTRSKAAVWIREGAVRINMNRVTDPAKAVKAGDVLTLGLPQRTLVVRVAALLPRRVGAAEAVRAYDDISAL